MGRLLCFELITSLKGGVRDARCRFSLSAFYFGSECRLSIVYGVIGEFRGQFGQQWQVSGRCFQPLRRVPPLPITVRFYERIPRDHVLDVTRGSRYSYLSKRVSEAPRSQGGLPFRSFRVARFQEGRGFSSLVRHDRDFFCVLDRRSVSSVR